MSTDSISPLRQRMIEDMNARKLCAGTQKGHIRSCRRFAAFLKRSPDTATAEDIRRFQLHLAETAMSICNRNRIMTGLRFLFRVTLRRRPHLRFREFANRTTRRPRMPSSDSEKPVESLCTPRHRPGSHSAGLAGRHTTIRTLQTRPVMLGTVTVDGFMETPPWAAVAERVLTGPGSVDANRHTSPCRPRCSSPVRWR